MPAKAPMVLPPALQMLSPSLQQRATGEETRRQPAGGDDSTLAMEKPPGRRRVAVFAPCWAVSEFFFFGF